MSEVAFAAVLLALLLMTLAANLPGEIGDWLRRRDIGGYLIQSSYFAPRPGRLDYVLLARHEFDDGAVSDWREHPVPRSSRAIRCIFNPSRRHDKAMADLGRNLGEVYDAAGEAALRLSLPYLLYLNASSAIATDTGPQVKGVQFTVLAMAGAADEDPEVLVTSDMHRLR